MAPYRSPLFARSRSIRISILRSGSCPNRCKTAGGRSHTPILASSTRCCRASSSATGRMTCSPTLSITRFPIVLPRRGSTSSSPLVGSISRVRPRLRSRKRCDASSSYGRRARPTSQAGGARSRSRFVRNDRRQLGRLDRRGHPLARLPGRARRTRARHFDRLQHGRRRRFRRNSAAVADRREQVRAALGIRAARVILFVGQFIERKGVRTLLEAYDRVRAR